VLQFFSTWTCYKSMSVVFLNCPLRPRWEGVSWAGCWPSRELQVGCKLPFHFVGWSALHLTLEPSNHLPPCIIPRNYYITYCRKIEVVRLLRLFVHCQWPLPACD
jgi:hypothetical protein